MENLAGYLEVGVYVKIIDKQNVFELDHSGTYLRETFMEGSRNYMFAVLELTLSCPVVVMRLLQCIIVHVVAFFCLIVRLMLAK